MLPNRLHVACPPTIARWFTDLFQAHFGDIPARIGTTRTQRKESCRTPTTSKLRLVPRNDLAKVRSLLLCKTSYFNLRF
jgi:hypothetical protein